MLKTIFLKSKIRQYFKKINGVDVTCKTHLECVKLIKKTGDTLALKVYTSKNFSSFATNLTNLTSTSAGIYQTPSVSLLNTSVSNSNSITKSHSYYATSTITTNNLATMSNEYHTSKDFSSIYFDGTKSLPNKKKRKFKILLFFFMSKFSKCFV